MLGSRRWALLSLALAFGCGDDAVSPDGGGPMCMTNADCDDGVFCSGVERCMPGAPGADARGCVALGDPCLGGQTCDEGAGRCATDCAVTQDADGDGIDAIECGGTDCNDSDAESYPGNTEICDADGRDEDCDPGTLGGDDADDDGYIDSACCNGDVCGQDCDDSEPSIRPTQTDSTCDGVDNDCDGEADEDATPLVYYVDRDGDGYGDESRGSMEICAPEVEGYARLSGDCDDDDEFTYPGAPEACDRIVNDCGTTPGSPRPEEDADNDGFAAPDADCEGGPLPKTDCDDERNGVNPDASERPCNGRDDDCDGMLATTEDMDGDGAPNQDCCGEGFRCSVPIDCDDTDPAVYLDAPNICDGQPNSCEPGGDEGAIAGPSDDLDGDGEAATDDACMDGPLPKTDCDDSNPLVGASIPEYCGDATDNDCDTMVDEGCPTGFTLELPGTAAMTVGTAGGNPFDLECTAGVARLIDVGPGGSGPLDALRGRCFGLQAVPATRGVPVLQLEVGDTAELGATTTLGTPEEVLGCSNDEEGEVFETDLLITSLGVRPGGSDGIEGLASRCAAVFARIEDGVIVDWIVNDRGGDPGDTWGRSNADMPSDCPAGTLPVGLTGSGEPFISELGLICADIVPTFD